MPDILETIAAHARMRVDADRERISLTELRGQCTDLGTGDGESFAAALGRPGLSWICEVKKASPSKGIISPDFPFLDIARAYERAGADCISCLTEPKWFLGSDSVFREIRAAVRLPMLRKDFVVDEYQLFQTRTMGANAVLLIVSLLDRKTLMRYLSVCESLGMAALVEVHNESEIDIALAAGARIVGVNNRNLRDFSVNFENAARLRDRVPPEIRFVAESGVRTSADAAALRKIGADAVLVGETLMRADDPAEKLRELRGINP